MTHRTKMALAAGVAVAGLLGMGGGVALAAGNGTQPAQGQAQGQGHKHGKAGLLARAEHGEVTLRGKQHRVVDVQRGKVDAVSATAISVTSEDGFKATYTVNGDTKVRKDRKASAIGSVATGDQVLVVATKSGTTLTATRVVDRAH
ncbi:hypothetical protein ACLLO4_31845 [Kutzneria viridogrisea]